MAPLDGLGPRRRFELGIDRLRLGPDRVAGDEKLDGDLREEMRGEIRQQPELGCREAHGPSVRRPRRLCQTIAQLALVIDQGPEVGPAGQDPGGVGQAQTRLGDLTKGEVRPGQLDPDLA